MEAKTVDWGLKEAYGAWASGRSDEGFSFAAGAAKTSAGEAASDLFELYVMADESADYNGAVRRVKDWAYIEAAEFVSSRKPQARITNYRLDWGRQAARDGLCQSMWGHLRGTGLAARAKQFQVGERTYQRVRDHVERRADFLLAAYEKALGAAIGLDTES